jgi:hypothetical protein
MKNIILKTIIVFIPLFIIVIGCNESDKNNKLSGIDTSKELQNYDLACKISAVSGSKDNIVGDWKLSIGKTVFFKPQIVDYSCLNIIYHFKTNDTLIIESSAENPIGNRAGIYIYHLTLENLYNNVEEKYTLKIGNLNWACGISSENMILNDTPLDGPILYFVRMK